MTDTNEPVDPVTLEEIPVDRLITIDGRNYDAKSLYDLRVDKGHYFDPIIREKIKNKEIIAEIRRINNIKTFPHFTAKKFRWEEMAEDTTIGKLRERLPYQDSILIRPSCDDASIRWLKQASLLSDYVTPGAFLSLLSSLSLERTEAVRVAIANFLQISCLEEMADSILQEPELYKYVNYHQFDTAGLDAAIQERAVETLQEILRGANVSKILKLLSKLKKADKSESKKGSEIRIRGSGGLGGLLSALGN